MFKKLLLKFFLTNFLKVKDIEHKGRGKNYYRVFKISENSFSNAFSH